MRTIKTENYTAKRNGGMYIIYNDKDTQVAEVWRRGSMITCMADTELTQLIEQCKKEL